MGRVPRDGGPLSSAEQQYVKGTKGIREAADGLERGGLVLADALTRVVNGPA